jgi:hypothetical protein
MHVWDMAHDVGSQEGVRLAVFRDYPPCQVGIEEFSDSVDTFVYGNLCHVFGRLNSQMPDPGMSKVLQHDAVVAPHFNYKGILVSKVVSDDMVGKGFEVERHVTGRAGEKGVIFVKHPFPVRLVEQLHHSACRAEPDLHGEMIFVGKLFGKKKTVAKGHAPEIDEWMNRVFTDKTIIHGSDIPFNLVMNVGTALDCNPVKNLLRYFFENGKFTS